MSILKKHSIVNIEYDFTKTDIVIGNVKVIPFSNIKENDIFVTCLNKTWYIDRCKHVTDFGDANKDIVISTHSTNNPQKTECYKIIAYSNESDLPK